MVTMTDLSRYGQDVLRTELEMARRRGAELCVENDALEKRIVKLEDIIAAYYYAKRLGPADLEMARECARRVSVRFFSERHVYIENQAVSGSGAVGVELK